MRQPLITRPDAIFQHIIFQLINRVIIEWIPSINRRDEPGFQQTENGIIAPIPFNDIYDRTDEFNQRMIQHTPFFIDKNRNIMVIKNRFDQIMIDIGLTNKYRDITKPVVLLSDKTENLLGNPLNFCTRMDGLGDLDGHFTVIHRCRSYVKMLFQMGKIWPIVQSPILRT